MARNISRGDIRTAARRDADMPNTNGGKATDADYNGWIQEGYDELYGILVEARIGYVQTFSQLTTVGASDVYALPADFLALVGFDYQLDVERYVPLKVIDDRQVTDYPLHGARSLACRPDGPTRLIMYPTPQAGQVYRLRYIKAPALLTTDGDLIDGVAGWERFIVCHAAAMARQMEGTDNRQLIAEREAKRAEINARKEERLLYEAGRIQDTESRVERDEADIWPAGRGWY